MYEKLWWFISHDFISYCIFIFFQFYSFIFICLTMRVDFCSILRMTSGHVGQTKKGRRYERNFLLDYYLTNGCNEARINIYSFFISILLFFTFNSLHLCKCVSVCAVCICDEHLGKWNFLAMEEFPSVFCNGWMEEQLRRSTRKFIRLLQKHWQSFPWL